MTKISTAKLQSICDPFVTNPWGGKPITPDEVKSIRAWQAIREPAPLSDPPKLTRDYHVKRIAWLVINGWDDEIQIDVGVPELNDHVEWPIMDGNHRFMAALIRQDEYIDAGLSGSCELLDKLKYEK